MAANSTVDSFFTVTAMEEVDVSKLWPAILYTSLMMLMGSVGNSVVCYVYGFRWQSTVTKIFIFSLAALDLFNSLVCMPTEITMLVKIVTFKAPWWCKISRFLTYSLNGSSSLILVAIALDRWYKVCRPLKCFFTHRRAKWTCGGAILLAASLSWPSLILYGNLTVPIVGTDTTGVTCLVSDDFIDTWWPLVFYSVYFTCYMCLVVAIVVLYSMIAVKLVQLKKQQKERLAAKYAGLRSSKLMYASQDNIAGVDNNDKDNVAGNRRSEEVKCGVKIQIDCVQDEGREQQNPTVADGVFQLQQLQEDIERRKSVSFRLPRKSTNSENMTVTPEAPENVWQTGNRLQKLEIMPNRREQEEERLLGANGEGKDDETDNKNVGHDNYVQTKDSAEDLTEAERLIQTHVLEMTRSQDSLQAHGYSDHAHLLSKTDSHSYTGSHDDTDEFEQGIHFISHNDLNWLHNPIVNNVTVNCQAQVTGDDTHDDVKDVSSDVLGDEVGSNCSLLGGKTETRSAKTRSDSFTLTLSKKQGNGGKSKVHKTSSDSNLVIPERHQSLTSARRSFLMLPGGYPGGHTPTSRLPTPTESPSPNGVENRSVLLSSKLILERLNKKMAYRPAKTTCMLFAISIVFVISFFPFFCIVIARAAKGRAFFATLSDAGVVVISIFIRSSFISNAANPIIYGLCNKQFRTECSHLIGRCYGTRRDGVTLRVIEATDDALASNS